MRGSISRQHHPYFISLIVFSKQTESQLLFYDNITQFSSFITIIHNHRPFLLHSKMLFLISSFSLSFIAEVQNANHSVPRKK